MSHSSPHTLPPPVTSTPALKVEAVGHQHRRRRVFVGPMPEQVLASSEATDGGMSTRKRGFFNFYSRIASGEDEDDQLKGVISEHAFQFFIQHGGREEDWGEQEDKKARNEMVKRWRESEWGQILRRRKKDANVSRGRWVGSSFEVGNFLGVNLLNGGRPTSTRSSSKSTLPSRTMPSVQVERPSLSVHSASAASPEDSFVTARSHATPGSGSSRPDVHSSFATHAPDSPRPDSEHDHAQPSHSTTHLLLGSPHHSPEHRSPSRSHTEGITSFRPHASAPAAVENDGVRVSSFRKEKEPGSAKKNVHYSESVMDAEPVPPSEVLARTGTAIQDTSAQAVEAIEDHSETTVGANLPTESVPTEGVTMQGKLYLTAHTALLD